MTELMETSQKRNMAVKARRSSLLWKYTLILLTILEKSIMIILGLKMGRFWDRPKLKLAGCPKLVPTVRVF